MFPRLHRLPPPSSGRRRGPAKRALAAVLALTLVGFATTTTAATAETRSPAPALAGDAPHQLAQIHLGVKTYYTTHTMDDGVKLGAFVIQPTTPGPHPVLIAPSSWSMNGLEYVGAAQRLAYESGYLVVSYTSRGFWDSGGTVALAGPRDVADVRAMIDWATTKLPGDPSRVGMFGISYGAGLSLLTAAQDPRVKAVVAMSGWTDMTRSFAPNHTLNNGGLSVLIASGLVTGRMDSTGKAMIADWAAGRTGLVEEIGPSRSPVTYVDQLNKRGTPVMLANAWGDFLFPPGQIVDYYNRLTVPKRLQLAPGTHATTELPGAFGIPDTTWSDATRWLNHYVLGDANGIATEQPVRLVPQHTGPGLSSPKADKYQGFPSFAAVTTQTSRRYLTASGTAFVPGRTGTLASSPTSKWAWSITGASPSVADARIPAGMAFVARSAAAVFQTEKFPTGATIGGIPRAHLTLTASRNTGTVMAMLYEVPSNGGLAKPLSFQPVTWAAAPGSAVKIDIALEATHAKIAPGSRLALVIDSYDASYRTASKLGDKITFTSPAGDPSYLDLPFGG